MIKKIIIGLIVLGGIGAFLPDSETSTASTTVEPKYKCLSSWDGSYGDLKRYTKKILKDPKSFEHDKTLITPIVDGYQNVFMTYRAKNGFGGINVERIGAKIKNSDCSLIKILS